MKLIYGILVVLICSVGVYGFDSVRDEQISIFTTEICEFKSNNGVPGLLIWNECISDIKKELELDIYRGMDRLDNATSLSIQICDFISNEGNYTINYDECIEKYRYILTT